MSIRVEAPGLLTTFQDLGRKGYQHLGVSPCGAMDELSHRLANLLVGNPPGAAALECTLAGPALRFEEERLIALCGADLSPAVEGRALPQWRPVLVRAGTQLTFGRPVQGVRAYLAVAGGFRIPAMMGSASTHLKAGFGGLGGRPLKTGDRLELEPFPRDRCAGLLEASRRRGTATGRSAPFLASPWFAPWHHDLDFNRPAVLRLVPGPQWPSLEPSSRDTLVTAVYRVAPASDRMGIRLQGPALALEWPQEMISAGVTAGTVQLPPDGAPIVLMADRQTTGGYPPLGEVAAVDLPRAAQLRPGEELRFQQVDLDRAQVLYLEREARFRALEEALAPRLSQDSWSPIP
jgi:antagonist of KipI